MTLLNKYFPLKILITSALFSLREEHIDEYKITKDNSRIFFLYKM